MTPAAQPARLAAAVADTAGGFSDMLQHTERHDWSSGPLGPRDSWPLALGTMVGVVLAAQQPMFLAWGEELVLLYNDAYVPLLGGKHPAALGRPFLAVWSEVAATLAPLVARVRGGESVHMDDITLVLQRHGVAEECHFAFSYTPVRGDDGNVAGLFCACMETTAQVLAARRLHHEQQRLQQMFGQTPTGMALLHGPEHVVELTNAAYQRLIGDRQVLGKRIRDALPEVEGQGFFELLDQVYRSGEAFVGQSVHADLVSTPGQLPTRRTLDFVYQPVTDADGRVDGIFVQISDVTDRATAEARLREQGARHGQILDSAIDYAIISADLQGRVTSWNIGAQRILGWSESEMLGHRIHRLYTADDVAIGEPDRLMAEVLGDARVDDERWHVRKNGDHFWAAGELSPLRDEAGTAIGYVKVVRDRTAERLAAHELAESQTRLRLSEESLRLATGAAEVGTWDLDLLRDELTWSDRTKAMFGFSPDDDCSMADFYAGLHPADSEATARAFASALDPDVRATYDVEYRTVGRNDGVVRWVAAKGKALFDDDARCVRAIGSAIDITARKSAQARQALLLELSDRLRAVSEPRAIVGAAVDALGQHLHVGRVGFALVQPDDETVLLETGYVDGVATLNGRYTLDVLGVGNVANLRRGRTSVYDDVPALDGDAHRDAMATRALVAVPLIRHGRFAACLFVTHQTPRAWSADDVSLIEDVAGRVWDAVERVRAEDELRDLNASLEARVEQRTAALQHAEDALRQSQKMEAVGQLTGGIAHDFNNLLAGISGSLELLRRKPAVADDQQSQRYVSVAMSSTQRAAALTQRLLAFARRQPLDPKPVAANALIQSMEDLLRRTLGPAITFEMVLAGGLWPTLCDPNQLESAILNLAINARDAMPDGGRLTVETCNAHLDDAYVRAFAVGVRPGQYIVVSVTDTGVGMTPDVVARAFEPFFTTKPIGQGTGLGLSMLYGFAKQSDGHAKVYSEPRLGTSVKVYLPRYRGSASAFVATDDVSDALLPRAEAGETVLVVEDQAAVRMLVVETLAELGYGAIEAADGPAGLELLQSPRRIDLLVTDVGLPGLNGRQLADAARTVRPSLKVLFITGYAGNAAVGNGVLEPGMELMTKPFAMDALAAKIRTMIERT